MSQSCFVLQGIEDGDQQPRQNSGRSPLLFAHLALSLRGGCTALSRRSRILHCSSRSSSLAVADRALAIPIEAFQGRLLSLLCVLLLLWLQTRARAALATLRQKLFLTKPCFRKAELCTTLRCTPCSPGCNMEDQTMKATEQPGSDK